jgi:hypothetical protein
MKIDHRIMSVSREITRVLRKNHVGHPTEWAGPMSAHDGALAEGRMPRG